jgi:hypothetical protein
MTRQHTKKKKKKNRRAPLEPMPPWRNLRGAAARTGRGRRFLLKEIEEGRLRAARIGGRQEVLTTDPWLDEWLANLSTVLPLPRRQQRSG